MIDSSNATIDILSVHHIGNKINGEDIIISSHPTDTGDKETDAMLKKYFLQPFQAPEFYHFTFSNGDHTLNPMNRFVSEIFGETTGFHMAGIHMARHLYEMSDHPMIKPGDLFIAYVSNILVDHKKTEAIGIFKSESRNNLLKLEKGKEGFSIKRLEGIQTDKPDKACLIFNLDAGNGYRVCIFDKSGKGEEAVFWKDRFLMLMENKDEFHQTRDFLNITRHYVTDGIGKEFEVNKSDKIDILNRSMDFFSSRDNFVREEFEEEVLRDPAVIDSFRKFDQTYRKEQGLDVEDSFDISLPAVKKQSRVFKSVLKLDRNFHIYIHGDKKLIEHGVEKDGRKFYKIYYDKEH